MSLYLKPLTGEDLYRELSPHSSVWRRRNQDRPSHQPRGIRYGIRAWESGPIPGFLLCRQTLYTFPITITPSTMDIAPTCLRNARTTKADEAPARGGRALGRATRSEPPARSRTRAARTMPEAAT